MILREQAPQQWDIFLRGIQLYAASVAADMVKADQSQLARAQGMALMVQEISLLLKNAPEQFEKYRRIDIELREKQRKEHSHAGPPRTG